MRKHAYLQDRDEGWDWLPAHVVRDDDTENAAENSPRAVFCEMAIVLAVILLVASGVTYAFTGAL